MGFKQLHQHFLRTAFKILTAVRRSRPARPRDVGGVYVAEGELSAECRTGDVLTWTFFCRDESGVGYEFFLREWTVEADGLARNAEGTEWPKLTWD